MTEYDFCVFKRFLQNLKKHRICERKRDAINALGLEASISNMTLYYGQSKHGIISINAILRGGGWLTKTWCVVNGSLILI